jgi:hypothetical protein
MCSERQLRPCLERLRGFRNLCGSQIFASNFAEILETLKKSGHSAALHLMLHATIKGTLLTFVRDTRPNAKDTKKIALVCKSR